MLNRITNNEDPDQTAQEQSDLGLHCLFCPFHQGTCSTSVQNLRALTVHVYSKTGLKQPLKKNARNWFSIPIIAIA